MNNGTLSTKYVSNYFNKLNLEQNISNFQEKLNKLSFSILDNNDTEKAILSKLLKLIQTYQYFLKQITNNEELDTLNAYFNIHLKRIYNSYAKILFKSRDIDYLIVIPEIYYTLDFSNFKKAIIRRIEIIDSSRRIQEINNLYNIIRPTFPASLQAKLDVVTKIFKLDYKECNIDNYREQVGRLCKNYLKFSNLISEVNIKATEALEQNPKFNNSIKKILKLTLNIIVENKNNLNNTIISLINHITFRNITEDLYLITCYYNSNGIEFDSFINNIDNFDTYPELVI